MQILNYKPLNKGALQGSFTLKIPKWGDFLIHEMLYFKSGKGSWVSGPQREYMLNGEKKYFSFFRFEKKEMQDIFSGQVVKVLEKYLSENSVQLNSSPQSSTINGQAPDLKFTEEVPF